MDASYNIIYWLHKNEDKEFVLFKYLTENYTS